MLLSIIKNGNASTVDVVNGVKKALKTLRAAGAAGHARSANCSTNPCSSRSRSQGVLREGAIAAGLTALMILLFLGSWRSTLVVMISIPLAILSSLVVLYFLGETLNTMTLGGLALAVGILVDDSTVTIENTHRLLTEERQPLPEATLHGAAGIAMPTLVSTLAISCVFTSVVFLDGPAKYLFTPLGLAVVFAMLASYGLSRTLTPITIGLLLKGEHHGPTTDAARLVRAASRPASIATSSACAPAMSRSSTHLLRQRVDRPGHRPSCARARRRDAVASSAATSSRSSTAGKSSCMSARPAGTRIESTERIFQAVEDKIREIIPENERELIVDNIGLPARAYNLAFTDGSTIGVNDGVILVSLKDGHAPTADYVRKLREALPAAFPDVLFYFQAADIVTQILNFGLPAQIDVRTVGYDRDDEPERREGNAAAHGSHSRASSTRICSRRSTARPSTRRSTGRARSSSASTPTRIATNLNVSLSSSEQVTPNFWTDPTSGIPYYLAVQTPEPEVASLNDLANTPVPAALSPHGAADPGPAQQRRDLQARQPCRPTPTRPTSSRSTTSTPACRAAISAAWRPTSTRSSPMCRSSWRRAIRSRSRARSRA